MSDFSNLSGNSDRNNWCIGCARIDFESMRLAVSSPQPLITAEHLINHAIAFIADPFCIHILDSTYVFAEVWNRSVGRGQIAVFQLDACHHVVESRIVLGEPFHLSYPCVFTDGDDYYMLPEAWESGQLLLYKARRFPWEWERFKVLLELDYADPQIFFHEHMWYIFLNTDPLTNGSASVFWSKSLVENWQPHHQNPIFSDDRLLARSAGPLAQHQGRILRFSQDCRQLYGQSVFASEIVELSPSRITTKRIGPVEIDRPEWALSAFHHLDTSVTNCAYNALFDGYTKRPDPKLQ